MVAASSSLTSVSAIFCRLSVALARSGVLTVFHTLEKKVGGEGGIGWSFEKDQTVANDPVFQFSFCV